MSRDAAQHTRQLRSAVLFNHSTSRHFMISFRKRRDRSSGARSQDLCVKVNVNYVSGPKAYGFKHHKDFMFCSVFFSMHFHEDFAASWGIKIQFSLTVYHWSFGKTSLCTGVSLMFLCFCMWWVCVYTSLCRCVHMHSCTTWRPEVNTGYLLNSSLPYFLRQDLSLKPELTGLATMLVRGQCTSASLVPGLQAHSSTFIQGLGTLTQVLVVTW